MLKSASYKYSLTTTVVQRQVNKSTSLRKIDYYYDQTLMMTIIYGRLGLGLGPVTKT